MAIEPGGPSQTGSAFKDFNKRQEDLKGVDGTISKLSKENVPINEQNISVNSILQGRISPSPKKKFSDQLILFRLALNNSKKAPEEIKGFEDYIHFKDLNSKTEEEVIELTALLFQGTLQNPKFFKEKEILSQLPEFAKKYYELLKDLNDGSINLEDAYKIMEQQTPADKASFYAKAAHIMNLKEIPIRELKDQEGWKTLDLASLAPYLKFCDVCDLNEDQIKIIFKYSTNINSLAINNDTIKELPSLPNCQYLACSCSELVSLPDHLLNCKMFSCKECKALTSLPLELPNCETFILEGCNVLTYLPDLPNCENFRCQSCEALTLLPKELPNCKTFICKECNSLTCLPDLLNCEIFRCKSCDSLTFFPDLPNCTKFSCKDCQSLTSLIFELPNCKEFSCERCEALTSLLFELPNCETFSCDGCKALNIIPSLPRCQTFSSSNCLQLTHFPDLPFCEEFDCSFCPNITVLPDLQLCKTLNCSSCSRLFRIPALLLCRTLYCMDTPLLDFPNNLPSCHFLFCEGCPIVNRLPRLALNAHVELGNKTESIKIDVDDLQKKPKIYLDKIGKIISKEGQLPKIVYSKNGVESLGLDVGGLRRDFISKLFKFVFAKESEADKYHLKSLNFDTKEGLEPIARKTEASSFHSLGQLFARCFLGEAFCTTGTVFRTSFFQSLGHYKLE